MIPLRDNIPSKTIPLINYLIIIANAYVFYLELKSGSIGKLDNFIFTHALVPQRFLANFPMEAATVFYSMFLHGCWLHFLGNMLYLYIFGDNVEDRLGHFRYIIFYLFCGVSAALLQMWFSVNSTVPMIGASGAISGVLGAYFVLYPKARILTLVPIWIFLRVFEVPGFFYLGFWFLLQLLSGYVSISAGAAAHNIDGVAFFAHIGGFIAGIFWIFFSGGKRRRG